ncbi:Retrotrans gag domain-containing protein [Abeliophyllum distichum]|uniref:Retrotrans gag domain-containing protein n=1 Tax=Abeliophyllum distichum TaxID=126358 RepID=A0ABD1SBJ1_9LAMI
MEKPWRQQETQSPSDETWEKSTYKLRAGNENHGSQRKTTSLTPSANAKVHPDNANAKNEPSSRRRLRGFGRRAGESPKKTRSFEVDDDDENLPFSDGIRNASIPHEFRVPRITPYTSKRDPLDHVNTYKMEMSLRGATPALKYRAFHFTLSGGAKRWYNKLVAGSISSWPELKRTFINYFSSGKPTSAPVQRIHDIRQVELEPLQSYLSRFNEEMLFCERITDAEVLSELKGGLDMNLPFWRDVLNKNPTMFDQLVEMITEEITNENMILHKSRRSGPQPNAKGQLWKKPG